MSQIDLTEISWPIYRLGTNQPDVEAGVTNYLSVVTDDEGTTTYRSKTVDDKNVPGTTLAIRRLNMLNHNRDLFNIKIAIFFVSDMLKINNSGTWFIDSSGRLFKYKKNRSVPLIYKKIDKVISGVTAGFIVQIEGISTRFKVLYKPLADSQYAGLLNLGYGQYVLYGLYSTKLKDTTRKI